MLNLKKLAACSFALVSLTTSAYAFDLSAMGGLTLSNLSQTTSLASSGSAGVGYGFGALLGHELLPLLSVETGLFYMQHKISLTGLVGTTVDGSVSFNNLSLPVMLRLTPLPFIAVEAGGYVGLASNATVSASSGGATSSASANANTDSGLIGGVTLMMPLAPTLHLRVSGFYEYGLTNLVNNASPAVNSRNIDILAGVMFDI